MQRFPLGQLYATPEVLRQLKAASVNPLEVVARHARLEQGSLSADDQAANEQSLVDGGRIFSAFVYGVLKVWVITEASREYTTILFPDEY